MTNSDEDPVFYRGPTPHSSRWLEYALKRIDDAECQSVAEPKE